MATTNKPTLHEIVSDLNYKWVQAMMENKVDEAHEIYNYRKSLVEQSEEVEEIE